MQTEDGIEHKFDVIACATGFNVQYMPHFPITGIGGAIMQEEWKLVRIDYSESLGRTYTQFTDTHRLQIFT